MFRKFVLRIVLALAACTMLFGGAQAQQAVTKGPRVLMLYDRAYGTDYEKIGQLEAARRPLFTGAA